MGYDADFDDDIVALEAPYLKQQPDSDPLTAQTGLDADGRRERAQKAARARWAKDDREIARATGLAMREATLLRFEQEVDPTRELPADERRRLAHEAWSAHLRLKAQIQWARRRAAAATLAAQARMTAEAEVVSGEGAAAG